ncbi:ELO family [Dichotomocladium elegans]|nr:ELO family [Dichotomocladium elegans]
MSDLATLRPIAGVPFPQYYGLLMDWKTPLAIAACYVTGVHLVADLTGTSAGSMSRVVAKKHGTVAKTNSSLSMTTFCLLHNLALCGYSAVSFYHLALGLHNARTRDGPSLFACDLDSYYWHTTLGYWGYLFYLSKYYEVVDTVIILLKGRRPSFLQTFHHAGAMVTMWMGIRYRTHAFWIFCTFNSLVHTVMYAYYAATTVGIHPPGKKYVTSMQITQFVFGNCVALSYLLVPGCTRILEQRLTIGFAVSYTFILLGLFARFARKTYGDNAAGAATGATCPAGAASVSSTKKTT